jgi:hypothetical protein
MSIHQLVKDITLRCYYLLLKVCRAMKLYTLITTLHMLSFKKLVAHEVSSRMIKNSIMLLMKLHVGLLQIILDTSLLQCFCFVKSVMNTYFLKMSGNHWLMIFNIIYIGCLIILIIK